MCIRDRNKTVTPHERTVTSFAKTEVLVLKIKTIACNEVLTGALRTPCVTRLEMQTELNKKNVEIKRTKSRKSYLCLVESHGLEKKLNAIDTSLSS